MVIHKTGRLPLLKITLALVLLNKVASLLIPYDLLVGALVLISILVWGVAFNFYKSPNRSFEGDIDNSIVSPADGKIVTIEEVFEPEYFKDKRLLVSVFMSVFNVHVNWFPIDNAQVVYKKHHKGRFKAAYLPKSSTENERSTLVLEREDCGQILVRQIAGAMAKRIVTYPDVGEVGHINDQFGFIKLGSRVDLYLPLGTDVQVELGQKVSGCKTVIATL